MSEEEKDEYQQTLDEVDKEIAKATKELDGTPYSDTKKEDDKNISSSTDTNPSKPNNTEEKDEKKSSSSSKVTPSAPRINSRPSGGFSQAYEEVPECDIYGNPIPKKEKDTTDNNYPKPPKREGKVKSDDKENNIMELFWKEFVLASYEWVINTSVDLILDFTDYVLYSRNEQSTENKKQKIDIYAIGSKINQETKEKMLKRKEIALRGFQEISDNLDKNKKGLPTEWRILKQEPKFFKELSRIYNKNPKDQTIAEKEMLQEFQKVPDTLGKMIDEDIGLKNIAIKGATCECVANYTDGYAISNKFSEALESLKNGLKSKNNTDIDKSMSILEKEIVSDSIPLFNEIREKLIFIKDDVKGSRYKEALNKVKEIQERSQKEVDSPDYWEKVILAKESAYFKEFEQEKENINKQDRPTISSDFDDNLFLLNQQMMEASQHQVEDKETFLNMLSNLSQHLDSSKSKEKEMQQYIKLMIQKVQKSQHCKSAKVLKNDLENFNVICGFSNQNSDSPFGTQEFKDGLKQLNVKVNSSLSHREEEKQTIVGLLGVMSKECNDKKEHKDIKDMLEEIKEEASKAEAENITSSIQSKVADFNNMYSQKNPIKKEKKEYYGNLINGVKNLDSSIKKYSKGLTSVLNRNNNKKEMHQAVDNMKTTFLNHKDKSGEPTVSPNSFDSKSISLEIMQVLANNKTR